MFPFPWMRFTVESDVNVCELFCMNGVSGWDVVVDKCYNAFSLFVQSVLSQGYVDVTRNAENQIHLT